MFGADLVNQDEFHVGAGLLLQVNFLTFVLLYLTLNFLYLTYKKYAFRVMSGLVAATTTTNLKL